MAVVSITLELHCLLTTYPLLGSVCPAHEPLVVRGIISVPKVGDVESSCERGRDLRPPWLVGGYRPPPLCCPTRHGVPLRLAGRSSGPDK